MGLLFQGFYWFILLAEAFQLADRHLKGPLIYDNPSIDYQKAQQIQSPIPLPLTCAGITGVPLELNDGQAPAQKILHAQIFLMSDEGELAIEFMDR
ncbi:hypothetical protein LYNGBM3L_61570 [Moorena producens 3L]|uniref:Uncharacterized protein n=1 Tax=Moorena producens 3L TaxID=489825 RepID=F4Y0L4_9CYAN|nr:hypothetical protein LYNGBM3L_61570 [Moorena producens 3L]OLT64594.1 hypothetical protein BI334_05750 [Moorena producens 3L]